MQRRIFINKLIKTVGLAATTVIANPLPVWSQERVFLTTDKALKVIFPKSEKILTEQKLLNDEQLKKISNLLRVQIPKQQIFFRGETAGNTDGYAMILNEIGKDQFITFIVGITPQFKVFRVSLMVFRETRGWEVQDARFSNQFAGKTSRDRLLVGADIVGITGATLSAQAFCRGTKKALALCETVYGA